MTRDRLEGLPINALMELCEKEGLDFEPDAIREELIENLLEAYEEDRRERETLHNLIIKIEQSKFSYLAQDELGDHQRVEELPIPDSYDDNSVSLLLRDPMWALVFWEIRKHDLDHIPHEFGFRGFALKVYENVRPDGHDPTFFLIPVAQAAGNRYIHLPTQSRWYLVELHALFDKESRFLARSKSVFAPLEKPAFMEEKAPLDAHSLKLLELSGIHLCEPVLDKEVQETAGETHGGIPQRIGDWDESLFQDQTTGS